ncbi:MAG: zinc-finger domain-containing protein [Betaproteobacteria bacterium]|nr:zinc-finger domain-containing protein [Betaproteobacteria bacterium]
MQKTIELLAIELNRHGGVFCPNPKAGMQVWNTHPKVFLDLSQTGQAKCPYCSTEYRLKPGEHVAAR